MRGTLILFTRAPHYGVGKTRLARRVGAREAYRFQRAQVRHLARRVGRDRRWKIVWAVTAPYPFIEHAKGQPRQPQGLGALGPRMQHALADVGRQAGRGHPVVLVGSDIPALSAAHVAAAFAVLRARDIVYGPADDGGFWLVGWSGRSALPNLFASVRWSQPCTLDDCLSRLHNRRGQRVGLGPCLADWDG